MPAADNSFGTTRDRLEAEMRAAIETRIAGLTRETPIEEVRALLDHIAAQDWLSSEQRRLWHEQTRARSARFNGFNHDSDELISQLAPHREIAAIPPRAWLYGSLLLVGEVAAIGALDGGGKGALAVVMMLAMITSRELLGEQVWRPGPVAIISYEDRIEEWEKRIAAACLHYGLDYRSVTGAIHFIRHPSRPIEIARQDPRGRGLVFPDGDRLVRQLKQIGAVLAVLDPLNHAHAAEANDNIAMVKVAGEIGRIARLSDSAILVLHHLRKGATGDPDDFMGATSVRAAFRAIRILTRMTVEEAEKLGLPREDAWRYSRISGTKENYAPPPTRAHWYKLESIDLPNSSEAYPAGDNVQVMTSWTPPSPFAGLSLGMIERIFTAIRQGPGGEERWAPDRRRGPALWVGSLIMELGGRSEGDAVRIVETWLREQVLIKGTYYSPASRHERAGVTLNEAKAAAILGPLYHHQPGEVDAE